MKQLDLGSGSAPRQHDGYHAEGLDIVPAANYVADLAIDPIPCPDNEFDLVTAYDFLEHIPAVLYIGRQKRNCMIELFNEIYRVLKPGGEFYMQTPSYYPDYNSEAVWSDPTHCFVWTPDTANHFSGDYYGQHDNYGHTSDFTKISQEFENGHIKLTLRANKPAREGSYLL